MSTREEPVGSAVPQLSASTIDDLARVLRQLRRRDARHRGGTQFSYRDLAARTGWSVGIIGAYFSGKVLPPTDRFDVLVRLLGASAAEQGALATARDRVEERRRGGAEPAPPPRPAQLPADVPAFTGRTATMRELDALLADREATAVVTGMAGVGKSALAVHWAYRVRERFPDGQLFVNLRGHAATPALRPIEALATVLRSLGVPAGDVPVDREEAAALYRSLLAGRRVLVLLDNAGSAEQVRPLLPGTVDCFVLVTSRDQLSGLVARDGARQVDLDVLTASEAAEVLARILGQQRVHREPEALAALAQACAHLPLALRIAAANLVGQPHLTVAEYLARLTTGDPLSALEIADDPEAAVRGAFDLSYQALAPDARRMFRLLGVAPGPELAEPAVAALTGVPPAHARRLLEALRRAHLVIQGAADRVALHDLLRCYAEERCAAETGGQERVDALRRLYEWYESGVAGCAARLYPERLRLATPAGRRPHEFADSAGALHWLDTERVALLPAVAAAARHGHPEAAWRIADGLRGYASQCLPTAAWLELANRAISAAESRGDAYGLAAAHLSRAEARLRQGAYQRAIDEYGAVAALSRRAGWLAGEAAALGNLGTVCRLVGRVEDAVGHYLGSLRLNERGDRLAGRAAALGGLGIAYRELGDLTAAAQHLHQAREFFHLAGSRGGEAIAWDNLAETYLLQGRTTDALDCADRALSRFREVGSRINEGRVLRIQADAHAAAGRLSSALDLADQAAVLSADDADHRVRVDLLHTIATVQGLLGDPDAARDLHIRALRLARETGDRYPEAANLLGLARLHDRLGATADAQSWGRQALAVAHACGYRLLHRAALDILDAGTCPVGADRCGDWDTPSSRSGRVLVASVPAAARAVEN